MATNTFAVFFFICIVLPRVAPSLRMETSELLSTTEIYDETCPPDFVASEEICYTLDKTVCPYNLPLPFDPYFFVNVSGTDRYRLSVIKDPTYDYYQWQEITGNYGKLFAENMTGEDEYLIAEYDRETSQLTYDTTNDNVTYTCAYNASDDNYCDLFDKICGNNTGRDSTNCHCRNQTGSYFCETKCNNFTTVFNETTCMECDSLFSAYKEPSIDLGFDYFENKIYVYIQWVLKLLDVDTSLKVHCYTDAATVNHDVSYRYNVFEFDIDLDYNDHFKMMTYTIEPVKRYIGHYWCVGFKLNYSVIRGVRSKTIIAQGTNNDRESFTVNVTVEEEKRTFPLTIHEDVNDCINNSRPDFITEVRFLHLYEKQNNSNSIDIAYRLYLNETIQINNTILSEVANTLNTMWDCQTAELINITVSPSHCLPEPTYQNINFTWEKTLLGMTTIPKELNLKGDSRPITRTCLGEYLYGTYWSEFDDTDVNNTGTNITRTLHNLTWSEPQCDTITNLKEIIGTLEITRLIDAHFISEIFANITNQSCDLKQLVELVSDIMDIERSTLRDAQLLLNSTDKLLHNLNTILNNYDYTNDWTDGYVHVSSKNINVQVTRICSDANITGAAFYERNDIVDIVPLNNSNIDALDLGDLKLAAYVSDKQLKRMRKHASKLIITAFRHDSLFNGNSKPVITGFLVDVHAVGFGEPFLLDHVGVLVRPDRKYRADLYGNRWDYGRDALWYNRRGKWVRNSERAVPFKDNIYICKFSSTGFFGVLVSTEGSLALSIIAAVGCALSMLGSVAVVVTAVIYKHWREKTGTKILINFVVTNLLQNIVMAVSSSVDGYIQIKECVMIGAFLHYSVISQFTWMIFIGYLQYQRYVRVYYTVSTPLVLLSSIVSWILPIVPVTTVLALKYEFYIQADYCYLNDKPLYYAVFLPISLTLIANLIIFVTILVHVCCKKNSVVLRDNITWLNLRLVILLYFLLGLYWVFGIAARFSHLVAFDYFFCISASLQGLVIFLYFIVFNKMTRNFWLKQLRRSEMITIMQIWLQQRKKIGKVKIDRSRTTNIKVEMARSLSSRRRKSDEKLT